MFSSNFSTLAAFAFLQGGLGGVFWISSSALLAEVLGIQDLASGLSMLWISIVAPATVAEPISFLLLQYSQNELGRTGTSKYKISIGFAGAMFVCGGLSLLVAKFNQQKSFKVFKKT